MSLTIEFNSIVNFGKMEFRNRRPVSSDVNHTGFYLDRPHPRTCASSGRTSDRISHDSLYAPVFLVFLNIAYGCSGCFGYVLVYELKDHKSKSICRRTYLESLKRP